MDDNSLDIILRLQDELSPALAKAQAAIRQAAFDMAQTGQAGAKSFQAVDEGLGGFLGTALDGVPIVGQLIAAFSFDRVLSFAESTIEAASRLEDLSRATGVSTDGLQRMAYVGQDAGIDIEQLSRGVEQFSSKLATGDGNATKAVEQLGLSVRDLIALGPEQAFVNFTAAAAGVQDPMDKAALYTDAFGGRLGRVLISLGDVSRAMGAVPQTAIISQENIASAHLMDVEAQHLKTSLGEIATSVFVAVGKAFMVIPENMKQGAAALAETAAGTTKANVELISSSQLWQNEIDALIAKQGNLSSVNVDQIANEAALGVSTKDLAAHYNLSEAAVSSLVETHKKYQASIIEVNSAGLGFQGTLETMNGDVVEAIKYYLDAGVAQDKLATFYGLTAAQVKAVATEMKQASVAQLELTKLVDQFADVEIQRSGTASDVQIANINRTFANLKATLIAQGKFTGEVAAQFQENWKQALGGVGIDWNALRDQSVNALVDTYNRAQATFEAMMTDGRVHSQAQIQYFRDLRDAALDALHGIGDGAKKTTATVQESVVTMVNALSMADAALGASLDSTIKQVRTLSGEWITAADAKKRFDDAGSLDVATAAQDPEIMAFLKEGYSFKNAEALKLSRQWGFTPELFDLLGNPETTPSPSERVPGYAFGVQNARGGWSRVGELGPETMFVPPGANIYPHGDEPVGTNVTNHFYVNGSIKDLAGPLMDEITRSMRSSRKWPRGA